MISSFTELLLAAKEQTQPQRLLFLFAKADVSESSSEKKKGSLTPVMCVDKLPEEIESFAAFSAEADGVAKEWDFIFAVGLSGANGVAPTTDEAEPYLNKMTNDLASGQNIAQYAVFDRNERPVMLQPS